MSAITTPITRKIIEDFAREVREKKLDTAKPSKHIINFRTDINERHERDIWTVPISLLRYRKDNGRIASDISDYERTIGPLDETDDDAQAIIEDFLRKKDPQKTDALRKSIIHAGQLEPAIITADGFLIDGNRRKMVLSQLHKKSPGEQKYAYLKVVALPGEGDPGGPPTLLDIEKLENRYQLQSDGKSEYYGFDRALSIKRKKELGLSLEEQLRDDPQFATATQAQLDKAVKDYKKRFLEPLECVDRYLKQFRREGQYRSISGGMADPEGRWQAFIDYSNTYSKCFKNQHGLIEAGISEEEVGRIEEAAFNIVRLRTIPDAPKVHYIMRNLPKYCKHGKRELLKIADEVEPILPHDEIIDEGGVPLSAEVIDAKWVAKNRENIIYNVKKSIQHYETKREKETPIGLIESAVKKLAHEDLDVKKMMVSDFARARQFLNEIKDLVRDINHQLYEWEKSLKKLSHKK